LELFGLSPHATPKVQPWILHWSGCIQNNRKMILLSMLMLISGSKIDLVETSETFEQFPIVSKTKKLEK